jgi:malonate transporter and related proteins
MLDTLSRVLLFFSLVGLGILLVHTRRLKAEGLDGLSSYFYWLAFPAFLVHAFTQLPKPDWLHLYWLMLYALSFLMSSGICLGIARLIKAPKREAVAAGMAGFISNSAFLGMPIALSLFGPEVLLIAPLFFIADFLLLFFTGCAGLALASGQGLSLALKRTFQNPTVLASVLGVSCVMLGFKLPPQLDQTLDILGRSSVPVALVALGGMLAFVPRQRLLALAPLNVLAVGAKLIIGPALMALIMHIGGAPPLVFKVAVFLSACPTAVSVFIQAKIYGIWAEGAAIAIAQSTVLALFTLSGLALILTHI